MAIKSVSLLTYSSAITVAALNSNATDNQALVTKGYVVSKLNDVTANVTLLGTGGLQNDGNGIYILVDNQTIERNSETGALQAKAVSAFDANKKGYLVKTDSTTGKIAYNLLPDAKINNVFTASGTGNTGEGLYSSANSSYTDITPGVGDICIVTDGGTITSYILTATPHTTSGNWVKLNTPSNSVVSITAGDDTLTGTITLSGATASGTTISIQDATTGASKDATGIKKGIASFNSNHFGASDGFISLKNLSASTSNGLSITSSSISLDLKTNGGLAYDSTTNATGLKVVVDNSTIGLNPSGQLYVAGSYASSTALTNLTTRVSTLEGYKHITAAGTEKYVLTADSNGDPQWSQTISSDALPQASPSTLGGVYVDDKTIKASNGVISATIPTYAKTTSNHITYKSGDVVSYGGLLYRCNKTTTTTANDFSTDNWLAITENSNTTYSAATTGALGLVSVPTDGGLTVGTSSNAGKLSVNVDESTIKVDSTDGLYAIGVYRGTYDTEQAYRINDIVSTDKGVFKIQKAVSQGTAANFPNMSNSSNMGTTSHLGVSLIPAASTSNMGITVLNSTIHSSSKNETQAATPKGVAEYVLGNVDGFVTYSNSSTYAVGDVVVYEGKLYKCKTAITTAESFTASKWQSITAPQPGIGTWRSGSYYVAGDLVYYNGSIYECRSAHTAASSSKPTANTQTTYWKPSNKYTGSISGTASNSPTQIEVNHNLGTQDLVVQVYKIEDNKRRPVLVDYFFGTTSDSSGTTAINNNVTFEFSSPQTNTDSYQVVIIAAK